MPIEKTYTIKEVIHAVKQHDWHGQRRLSFEYILFKDLNHSKDHIKEIARLLGSTRCRFNLIRYHTVPNIPLKSPDAATMTWFRDALNEKGIIATNPGITRARSRRCMWAAVDEEPVIKTKEAVTPPLLIL